jgi:DNA-binding response OmpR family regulator
MAGSASPPRPRVLIVDDDPSVRETLACALGRSYAVQTAATGTEACALLRGHPVGVIILDIVLPDADGLELLPKLRALSLASVLVLTGHSSEALAIRALRARVDEYLLKPPRLGELSAAVARLMAPRVPRTDPVRHARALLDTGAASSFNVTELAATVGVSERQLRRHFREATGVPPREHLRAARMREALRLLRETKRSIADIARALGYQSVRRFARAVMRDVRCGNSGRC